MQLRAADAPIAGATRCRRARWLWRVSAVVALSSALGCGGGPQQHLTQVRLDLGGSSSATRRLRPTAAPPTARLPALARAGATLLAIGEARIIATPSSAGAQLIAADASGRVTWRRSVAGGQFAMVASGEPTGSSRRPALLWLPTSDGDAHGLVALDATSGEQRWRTSTPAAIVATAWLPPYVVVQAGPALLLVHSEGGAVDARWQAAGLVGAGAGSWIWLHDKGHLSGIDITRVRCAAPGCRPRRRWRAPFAGVPRPTGGALCGQPMPRLRSCVDGVTGERLWLDYAALLPTLSPGRAALIARGDDGWGHPYVASLQPRDLGLRWRRSSGAAVHRVSLSSAVITAWASAGLTVIRAADGRLLGRLPVPTRLVRAVAASPKTLTWVFGAGRTASVGHERLGDQTSPAPRPETASPPWLRAGVVLHYVDVRFERRDPATGGLLGAQPPRHVHVRIERLGKNVTLRITGEGLKPRTVTVPRAQPTELVPLLVAPTEKQRHGSPVHVSLAALRATRGGAHISLLARDQGATFAGYALHRVGFVGRNQGRPAPRDLRAMRLRGVAGRGSAAHDYLIAPWATLPLVLRIDGARRLLLLTAVVADTD